MTSGSLERRPRRRKQSSDQILMWGIAGVLSAGLVGAGWWAVKPFRQGFHRSTTSTESRQDKTPAQLLPEAQTAYSSANYDEAISRARLGLTLLENTAEEDVPDPEQLALEMHLRELLARSYVAVGESGLALTQWRSLSRMAPENTLYQRNVAALAGKLTSMGLKLAASDLEQAGDLFRHGQQPEGIRRARLALELFKEHGGSKREQARAAATLGEMLWIRREVARARLCLEQAAELGYSEPSFLKFLAESRHGAPPSEAVGDGQPATFRPQIGGGDDYPHSHVQPSVSVGPEGPVVAHGPSRIAPPSRGPHKDPPRLVLPSVQVPPTMAREGNLPSYERPGASSTDVLPSYRNNSGSKDSLPSYETTTGTRPGSDRLPTY